MPRFLTIALGSLIIIVGLSVSLIVFAVLLLFGSIVFAYYWWKTRKIRSLMKAHIEERMRQQHDMAKGEGVIIEGEWQSDSQPGAATSPEVLPSIASANAPEKD